MIWSVDDFGDDQTKNELIQDSSSPEEALWKAVLMQVFVDARSKSFKQEKWLAKQNAIHWLFFDKKDFEYVCGMAGYNHIWVREKVVMTMNDMGKILALDLGTNTGWAVNNKKGQIISGVQSFKPSKFEGGGMRFLNFNRWLSQFNKSAGIDQVYFEAVRGHKGVDAAHIYGGLMGQLTAWCEYNKIPYKGIPATTIKKFWTGKGNCNKEAMIEKCHKEGFKPEDDNEADALALLNYAIVENVKI